MLCAQGLVDDSTINYITESSYEYGWLWLYTEDIIMTWFLENKVHRMVTEIYTYIYCDILVVWLNKSKQCKTANMDTHICLTQNTT